MWIRPRRPRWWLISGGCFIFIYLSVVVVLPFKNNMFGTWFTISSW